MEHDVIGDPILDSLMSLSTLILLIPAFALAFSIFKFSRDREKSNDIQFIQRLETFETELKNLINKFNHSSLKLNDCRILATGSLEILNKISYFKKKGFVDDDFVEYFKNNFHIGRYFLNWLTVMFPSQSPPWKNYYRYFREIDKDLIYPSKNPSLRKEFYFYENNIDNETRDKSFNSDDEIQGADRKLTSPYSNND